MQDPDHQKAKCAKCQAGRGEPCIDRFGNIADKVHYGRPYWSAMVDRKMIKLQGRNFEQEYWLEEFTVVKDLITRRTLDSESELPVLFAGTDICADCGDSYSQPGLMSRCKPIHAREMRRLRMSDRH